MFTEVPVEFVSGDAYQQGITLTNTTNPTFDWTGVPIRIQFKKSATDQVLFELANGARSPSVDPQNYALLSVNTAVAGSASFTIYVPSANTTGWPQGAIFADIVTGSDGGTLGVSTPVRLQIQVYRSMVNRN